MKKNRQNNEKKLQDKVYKQLVKDLKFYEVLSGKSWLYELIIESDGKLKPPNYQDPSRGHSAFQTDISITNCTNKTVPLVVLELKYGEINTDDILTYSTKALSHKKIYPYLRYGLIIGSRKKIDRRFFVHNTGFDFALTVGNYSSNRHELTDMVKRQLKIAEELSKIIKVKGNKRRSYETIINFDKKG